MLATVSALLRAPSKWAGLDCCVVYCEALPYWLGLAVEGVGFVPRIVKPEAGWTMTWYKRVSRAHIPSFEVELENTVSSGL